jgi:hypothetical protein
MTTVSVEGRLEAGVDEVWKLVGDFTAFVSYQGREVTTQGEGVGMLRHVPAGDIVIVERLEVLDDVNHRTSYSLVGGEIPLKNYSATIQLDAVSDGGSLLTWSAAFEPDGVTEEQAIRIVTRTYEKALQELQRHFAD